MWMMTSFGILMPAVRPPHTVPEGDNRTMQVRAREEAYLQILRDDYMGDTLGETLATPDKDYQFRAYCTPEDFAAAAAKIVMDIDYAKFKPTTARYEDRLGKKGEATLHGLYNAMWSTQLTYGPKTGSSYSIGAWNDIWGNAKCGAPKKKGGACRTAAGAQTGHKGMGYCKDHTKFPGEFPVDYAGPERRMAKSGGKQFVDGQMYFWRSGNAAEGKKAGWFTEGGTEFVPPVRTYQGTGAAWNGRSDWGSGNSSYTRVNGAWVPAKQIRPPQSTGASLDDRLAAEEPDTRDLPDDFPWDEADALAAELCKGEGHKAPAGLEGPRYSCNECWNDAVEDVSATSDTSAVKPRCVNCVTVVYHGKSSCDHATDCGSVTCPYWPMREGNGTGEGPDGWPSCLFCESSGVRGSVCICQEDCGNRSCAHWDEDARPPVGADPAAPNHPAPVQAELPYGDPSEQEARQEAAEDVGQWLNGMAAQAQADQAADGSKRLARKHRKDTRPSRGRRLTGRR